MTGIFPISKTIESDINKFAPSPFPLPRGERVRERVTMKMIYAGIIKTGENFLGVIL